MKRRVQGFTLVELIIVISIVGILAAVAMPRFIEAQKEARIAKTQALFGSIRSAAGLARARCELDLNGSGGSCTSTGGTVNMDGATISMAYKYPIAAADNTGILGAAQIDSDNDGMTIAGGGTTALTLTTKGAANSGNCVISYTAATSSAAPLITVVTSGC